MCIEQTRPLADERLTLSLQSRDLESPFSAVRRTQVLR